MAAASSSQDTTLPMNTILHLITIRLSSTNYLLWKNQMMPFLNYQLLLGHVDGSSQAPPSQLLVDNKPTVNPAHAEWLAADQRAIILLQASLTEEAFSRLWVSPPLVLSGWLLKPPMEIPPWNVFKIFETNFVFSLKVLQVSQILVVNLRLFVTNLRPSVTRLMNQTKLIGSFVVLVVLLKPFQRPFVPLIPTHAFRDLLAQAEGHELFLRSIHGTAAATTVAFSAETSPTQPSLGGRGRGGGGRSFRGDRGRGRCPPHCQLCRQNSHYANVCPKLTTFASPSARNETELAKAFLAKCHVNSSGPDWYVDSRASDHMVSSAGSVSQPEPFGGGGGVQFGDGNTLPISSIGTSTLANGIRLRDVLMVPHLTKNLLSISKLTYDNDVNVVFSKLYCLIQDRLTRRVLAQGRCDRGLYVLSAAPKAYAFFARTKSKASFELWHSRLGHVSFDIISVLNKLGHLLVSSILPKPVTCSPCQLAKSHRLPFDDNNKRALHVLDLVHCDLWGPSPVSSNQFSCKVKVFQTDGGTEFLNHNVKTLLTKHDIFHQISCPYTPQQNGRVERKHRHIVETGLAMERLEALEIFLNQADHLRQQTLQQMYRLLTIRQAARALLVLGEYFNRLRVLSSLWSARPHDHSTTLIS
ncbi:hypothetical protein OSB04_019246 [Centaurea solstitialis]|uniref:Integrase catalytic domain-containing protein n=1 Tax=Centaurea solstitialis TaxID=347529 RepID=A0AA38SQH0_9ASTR|nr:hypothetical protein OSB04_019246 [Centaurea solstitialis]